MRNSYDENADFPAIRWYIEPYVAMRFGESFCGEVFKAGEGDCLHDVIHMFRASFDHQEAPVDQAETERL
jgi:hypothetical protein